MVTTDESLRRTARVLTGFMTDGEAQGFAMSFAIDPQGFLNARQAQSSMRGAIPSIDHNPKLEDLPASMHAHAAAVRSHAAFAPAYGTAAQIRLVELGKLIAFQHWMDTDVSQGVHGAGLDEPPSEEHLLQACLPPTIVSPARIFALPIKNGVTV